MAEIKSINQLLAMNLGIPDYQRPYKWTIQNIVDLLDDIRNAIADADRYRQGFKYRIGTIILHRNEDGVFEVVDGQQRIISLTLLKLFLRPDFHCAILDKDYVNRISQRNIHANYLFIREWFSLKGQETRDAFCKAKFTANVTFTSPSTAAAVIIGYNVNGLNVWKTEDGIMLRDLQWE